MKIQHLNQWYPVFSDDQYIEPPMADDQRIFADDYEDEYRVEYGEEYQDEYFATSPVEAFNEFNID